MRMGPLASMLWAMALGILGSFSVLFIYYILFIIRASKANDFLLQMMIFLYSMERLQPCSCYKLLR